MYLITQETLFVSNVIIHAIIVQGLAQINALLVVIIQNLIGYLNQLKIHLESAQVLILIMVLLYANNVIIFVNNVPLLNLTALFVLIMQSLID